MNRNHSTGDLFVDANGCLTESFVLDGQAVMIHYDDIPESDITTVDGIRCTTPIRTMIDIAPEVDDADLRRMVENCLERGLFRIEEAIARLEEPDMTSRAGAKILARCLLR